MPWSTFIQIMIGVLVLYVIAMTIINQVRGGDK